MHLTGALLAIYDKLIYLTKLYKKTIETMKYFVAVNGQQTGPFEEDQLLAQNVTPDTLIWTEGMDR